MKHYSYPQELASILKHNWDNAAASMNDGRRGDNDAPDLLPDSTVLEFLLSVCFQASLMKDEGRQVIFRLLVRDPSRLTTHEGPPTGLHRVVFSEPRPFDENELRHLSAGADFYRSLIGANLDRTEGLRIWGLVSSGSRWIQSVHGGRKASELLPPSLIVRVTGPGRLAVCKGSITIATLNSGRVFCPTADDRVPQWLQARFTPAGNELFELHHRAREIKGESWATLDETLLKTLTQHVYRRIVSIMRNRHHGGTLILIPSENAAELSSENRYVDIKYRFIAEEPRHRLASLYLKLMNALAEEGGKRRIINRPMEWNDYATSESTAVRRLDEAIFEAAHFIADLTTIDGAVVMTKSLELLGFGGEILSRSNKMQTVARILDADGEKMQVESAYRVGTRHRSAYRLCHELHSAVAIVVSQDGTVRVITWKENGVVYWDQATISVLDL